MASLFRPAGCRSQGQKSRPLPGQGKFRCWARRRRTPLRLSPEPAAGPKSLSPGASMVNPAAMDNYVITSEDRDPQSVAASTATLAVDALPEWLGQTYTRVIAFLKSHNSYPIGPPFA